MRVLNLLRVVLASLVATAIAYQAASLVERDVFKPENFFSFFTIESNAFAAMVLVLSAVWWTGDRPGWVDAVRGAAVLYMATTGIVFALLLQGLQEQLQTHIPWVDFVLHKLFPVVFVLDWLVDPPRRLLALRLAAIWLVYPVAYVAYSLVRGEIVDWYPYPFLDAGELGYDGVAVRAVVLLVGFGAVSAGIVAVGNWLSTRRAAAGELR